MTPRHGQDPLTENLIRIRNETESTRQKTLGSTRLIVDLFHECEDAGVHTLTDLYHQKEQINRTEENLHGIHDNLKKAEKQLIKMTNTEKCCCCCCVLPCNRKHKGKNEKLWLPPKDIDKKSTRNFDQKNTNVPKSTQNKGQFSPQFDQTATMDKGTEVEISENLDEISLMIKKLKNIALDMDQEATAGNQQLDRLNPKAESTNLRLSSLNKQSEKLLRMNSTWCCDFCNVCSKRNLPSKLQVVSKVAKFLHMHSNV